MAELDQSLTAPVRFTRRDLENPEPPAIGTALCLSGGGYRAMLFHVGAIWRLNELGYLLQLKRISSVSGGSITAGVLGMNWASLKGGAAIQDVLVKPVRKLASVTVDVGSILVGGLVPGISASDRVVAAYRRHVFGRKTLQDLPDDPRFVFNATNVQSGALWRFSKPYMADWRVGRVNNPKTELAFAVASSSAFPPVLSPAELSLEPGDCVDQQGTDLHRVPYTTDVVLSDGGVYDNLGLETAWKNYTTIFTSDGGGQLSPNPDPPGDWARHTVRILEIVDNQVRSLRKRQLIGSYKLNNREGAYWGIRSNVADYQLPSIPGYPFTPAALPHEKTLALADVATRLKAMDKVVQERLINWGYAVCDVAIRRHVDSAAPLPQGFPYSEAGIG